LNSHLYNYKNRDFVWEQTKVQIWQVYLPLTGPPVAGVVGVVVNLIPLGLIYSLLFVAVVVVVCDSVCGADESVISSDCCSSSAVVVIDSSLVRISLAVESSNEETITGKIV